MYHGRFKGSHYDAGFRYGALVKKNGVRLNTCPTFPIDEQRIKFGRQCVAAIEVYYPEIVAEVRGLADGNEVDFDFLATLIFTMYCYETNNRCSCFAFSSGGETIFGRNSDFLVSLEKLYMNVLYGLDGVYSFNGNTTAFVEMEDGVNQHGLAVGLTFIPIENVKPGFNVGIITRYLLEKCQTVQEALDALGMLPIASGGTLTIADSSGDMAVVELTADEINVIRGDGGHDSSGDADNTDGSCDTGSIDSLGRFVLATNVFTSEKMKKYNLNVFDNWRAEERYETIKNAFSNKEESLGFEFASALLSGKYGFMCQYDRRTNADTVWSVIYNLTTREIHRVEGNPSRKPFKHDERILR